VALRQKSRTQKTLHLADAPVSLRVETLAQLQHVAENRLRLGRFVAGNLYVSFAGVDGDALLVGVPDVAVSTGSACNSHGGGGSHVLRAIGVSDEMMQSATRFGLGRFTTEEEVDYAAERFVHVVRRLREQVPV